MRMRIRYSDFIMDALQIKLIFESRQENRYILKYSDIVFHEWSKLKLLVVNKISAFLNIQRPKIYFLT